MHGSFTATRGEAPELVARGVFALGRRVVAVVDDPYGPPRLVDPDTGRVNGLFAHGNTFVVGSGFATERPARGTARFSGQGARVLGVRRVARRPTAAGGAHPGERGDARRDAHSSGRRRPTPGRCVRHRFGCDRACLSSRPFGDAPRGRCRGPHLRQARRRAVRRVLSRRVTDDEPRSTSSPATRLRQPGSWPASRASMPRKSASPVTARRAGSCRSPRRARRGSGS